MRTTGLLVGTVLIGGVLVVALLRSGPGVQADEASPQVAAEDLKDLAELFLRRIEETVSDAQGFASQSAQDARYQNAHALAVVAVAWGRMARPQTDPHAAAALWQAALRLADAQTLQEAQTALKQAKAALKGQGRGEKLPQWHEPVAELDGLMQIVGTQQNRINRSLRRLRRRGERVRQAAAFMAAVARLLAHHVPEESEADQDQRNAWQHSARQMEHAALALLQAATAKDVQRARKANTRLDQACHRCHEAMGIEE